MMLRRRTRLMTQELLQELVSIGSWWEKGEENAYIEPSVNTTLRIIFCLNSSDNLQTIGIGKAKIIRSAVACQNLSRAYMEGWKGETYWWCSWPRFQYRRPSYQYICLPQQSSPCVAVSSHPHLSLRSDSPIRPDRHASKKTRKDCTQSIPNSTEQTAPPQIFEVIDGKQSSIQHQDWHFDEEHRDGVDHSGESPDFEKGRRKGGCADVPEMFALRMC